MGTQAKYISTNYSPGRQGRRPEYLVFHTMQGFLGGTDAWFNNPKAQVSAHAGIGLNGERHDYVRDEDMAWAVGAVGQNPNQNLVTLSLETEDNNNPQGVARTPQQYQACAEWAAEKCRKFGIPADRAHFKKHCEVPLASHPQCCGNLDVDYILSLTQQILGAQPAAAPAPAATTSVIPLSIAVEIRSNVKVRSGASTDFPDGQGRNADGSPTNDTGNLNAGQVITIKGYVHGQQIGDKDIWLQTLRGCYIIASATNFYEKVDLNPAPAPAPAPAAPVAKTPPAKDPKELFSEKYGIAALPEADQVRFASQDEIRIYDLDSQSPAGDRVWGVADQILVKYAANHNGEIYYMTESSFAGLRPTGFRANDLVLTPPVVESPIITAPAQPASTAPVYGAPIDGIIGTPPAAQNDLGYVDATPQPTGTYTAVRTDKPVVSTQLTPRQIIVIVLAFILSKLDHKKKEDK